MQHLATQTLAFSTEIAQIFRALKKSKKFANLLQKFREFLERALHKTLDVCQILAGGGAVFSLESAQRLATQKFACNADSAEIVQIFRAKVRELVANFLRL